MMTDPTELDLAEMVSRADDYARAYVEALQGQPNRMPDIAHQIIADIPALVARVRELTEERDYEARRAAELSEEIANCNVLATEARATAAEAVVARVATREFAERYLAEWVKPYFGDDATDAAACVQRAMTAALAPTTTEGSEG